MMTRKTVIQLLQVFEEFRNSYLSGVPLHKSYQDAVRKVASHYSVTYQTIGDGCRRRLKLDEISQLYGLLENWMQGDSKGLCSQLTENSDPNAHPEIESFFSKAGSYLGSTSTEPVASITEQKGEPFTFRLSDTDARMLRALAEIEGSSPSQLVADIVQEAVQKKMKDFAEKMVGVNST